MTSQTATEKDMFLTVLDDEYKTSVRVLQAYPPGKEEFRPAEKTRSGRELAWVFVQEAKVAASAIDGQIDFAAGKSPAPSGPLSEILKVYEQAYRALRAKVEATPESDLQKTVTFLTGPKQMGEVPRLKVAWFMLMDSVHHRGQMSIYLRLLGAKVPSIYGPTADEPWM